MNMYEKLGIYVFTYRTFYYMEVSLYVTSMKKKVQDVKCLFLAHTRISQLTTDIFS